MLKCINGQLGTTAF